MRCDPGHGLDPARTIQGQGIECQIAGQDMTPATMLDAGVALELAFVGLILVALHGQLGIETDLAARRAAASGG
jgi:hypothetical protein